MNDFERHQRVVSAAQSVLHEVFTEANVDTHPPWQTDDGKFKSAFIVLFPELTIRNSRGLSHRLYDLYIKIAFIGTGLAYEFQGTRGKVSQVEAASAYCHSHLDGSASRGFSNFCQGSSNFQHTKTLLGEGVESWLDESNTVKEDKLFIFEGWLHEMVGFLEWESLAGRPYKYMESIGTGSNNAAANADDIALSYLRFLKNADYGRLKLTFDLNRYRLEDNLAFQEQVLKAVTKFQFRSEDGKFYDTTTLFPVGPRANYNSFVFKGRTIVQEVFPSATPILVQREVFPHQTLKAKIYEYVQRDLQRASEKWSRENQAKSITHRIARVRDTYSQREMLPENLIPVSGS